MLNVKIKILSSYFIRKSISLDYKSYKYISSSINLLLEIFFFFSVVVVVKIQAFSGNNRQHISSHLISLSYLSFSLTVYSFRSHKSNVVYWEACKQPTKKQICKNSHSSILCFTNAYDSNFQFVVFFFF